MWAESVTFWPQQSARLIPRRLIFGQRQAAPLFTRGPLFISVNTVMRCPGWAHYGRAPLLLGRPGAAKRRPASDCSVPHATALRSAPPPHPTTPHRSNHRLPSSPLLCFSTGASAHQHARQSSTHGQLTLMLSALCLWAAGGGWAVDE